MLFVIWVFSRYVFILQMYCKKQSYKLCSILISARLITWSCQIFRKEWFCHRHTVTWWSQVHGLYLINIWWPAIHFRLQWSLTYSDTSFPRLTVRITEFPYFLLKNMNWFPNKCPDKWIIRISEARLYAY